ncbi:MAG: HAMP domain-containing protein, partial [Flavobacteriales bacterium]|nr:HAMP domain-containing protein [Flavobacteriales bacterium]
NDPTILDKHHDAMLNDRCIRMMRIPLEHDGHVKGYIVAAMSSESAHSILITLLNTLIIAYLTITAGLYFFSRFLAGKSMAPVVEMTRTMSRITRNTLTERVQLPAHKDELYELSTHFNALLERIEKAIDREKQFTSDASHELRTPLATLRGTLEVLIRKSRTEEEYQDKINYCLSEIDNMSSTLEQLLLLARLDATDSVQHSPAINLKDLVDSITHQLSEEMASKSVRIDLLCEAPSVQVPEYHARLMLENVLSNAIKYSHDGGTVLVHIFSENEWNVCTVTNTGIGIKPEDLDHVFDAFFRSAPLEHKHIPGNGLGLSIAQRCAKAIDATITLKSDTSSTTATLNFKPILREI